MQDSEQMPMPVKLEIVTVTANQRALKGEYTIDYPPLAATVVKYHGNRWYNKISYFARYWVTWCFSKRLRRMRWAEYEISRILADEIRKEIDRDVIEQIKKKQL